jgi:2-isopropylmalate synthase
VAIVEVAHHEVMGSRFGVGIHTSIATASVLATLCAFNRLGLALQRVPAETPVAG